MDNEEVYNHIGGAAHALIRAAQEPMNRRGPFRFMFAKHMCKIAMLASIDQKVMCFGDASRLSMSFMHIFGLPLDNFCRLIDIEGLLVEDDGDELT